MTPLLKNQSGAAAIMLTLLIMSAILMVSIAVSDLIQNGIVASRTQVDSTKAFFAAESGIEQALDYVWKGNLESDPLGNDDGLCLDCSGAEPFYLCFDAISGDITEISSGNFSLRDICSNNCAASNPALVDFITLGNGATYKVEYDCEDQHYDDDDGFYISTTTFSSLGSYQGVNRVIDSSYNGYRKDSP